jgi:hypothetical protein
MDHPSVIRFGDVFSSRADIVTIPHSTAGTVSSPFEKYLETFGLSGRVPRGAKLGDVNLFASTRKTPRPVAYAFCCTVEENRSNYTAIRKIGIALAEKTNEIKAQAGITEKITVAAPILGSGAGGLTPVYSAQVLYKAFTETTKDGADLSIYSLQEDTGLITQFNEVFDYHYNSVQTAFIFSIYKAEEFELIKEIAQITEFYFEKARAKYQEFSAFRSGDLSFYQNLLNRFDEQESNSFDAFLNSFRPFSDEYKFLQLCGELIAYIDRNGFNKAKWNEYPDKRTIAKSMVRQQIWLKSLIRFKSNANRFDGLSASVVNALKYLMDPIRELPMLSENHRKALLKNIFELDYTSPESLNVVFDTFKRYGLTCKHDNNTGLLYARFLYLPEIKELWLPQQLESEEEIIQSQSSKESNPIDPSNRNVQTIQTVVHSDAYAKEDLLNYKLYAKSIVKFLTHKNTTPPLTVGIMAPWGKGKTTLMRFIIDKLNEERSSHAANKNEEAKPPMAQRPKSNYRKILSWIKQIREKGENEIVLPKLEYPVVWFNAWKFQKEEQIWAGFAHEIIQQLVSQITNPVDREKFWLYLNAARIDTDKIRQDIYAKLFQKIWVFAAIALAFALALGAAILLLANLPIAIATSTAGLLTSIIARFNWAKGKLPDVDVTKYIQQPVYKEKMGYLYEVEQDLRRVLKLLVSQQKPAVIFIDDLDRCAPDTTAEVVEAINLFISGDLPDCYFVIGQDAQMVAAALDSAYKEIGEKVQNIDRHHGSLGWYFMEKFVQLQFNIPALTDAQCQNFLKHLFKEENKKEKLGMEELEKKLTRATERIKTADDPASLFTPEMELLEKELAEYKPETAVLLKEQIIDKMANDYDDNDSEVLSLIEELSPTLGNSPRKIKRFVNLYRFYRFMQFSGQSKLLREVDAITLARWIVIMIRWPQLVRAIQWETDSEFITGLSSLERAKKVQDEINKAPDYNTWQQKFKTKNGESPHWIVDSTLFHFVRTKNETHFLQKPVELGMW